MLLGRGEWEASWPALWYWSLGLHPNPPSEKTPAFLGCFLKALDTLHLPRDRLLDGNMMMKSVALLVPCPLDMWLLVLMPWSHGQALTQVIPSRVTTQAW